MGLFSSGKKYKKRAEAALRTAEDIQDYQSEQEFRRNLLSNIRQERIARAQLEVGNYSTNYSSSSAAGAIANIDSSLSGETYFSYASSDRAQRITDLHEYAEKQYEKYAKQQKKRATAFSVAGTVAGAVAGGLLGPALGGLTAKAGMAMGGQIGQGLGQIVSGTGQEDYGISNIISGTTGWWLGAEKRSQWEEYLSALRMNRYELASVNPQSNQIIPGSQVYAGNYMLLNNIKGYRS